MVKLRYIITLTALILCSCIRNIELDMQHLGDSSSAFIECYCQRGELYNLTATYLSPIDTPQTLDYTHKFECYITDSERHRLSQSIFIVDNKIYSHGAPTRLDLDFEGELTLDITSEYGDHFTATSAIPDPVGEFRAEIVDNNKIVVTFNSSASEEQNYYAISAVAKMDDKTTQTKSFLSNPECNTTERIELILDRPQYEATSIKISLIRLTYDGFIYQQSILENLESLGSNVIVGTKLRGNIEGCHGVFTCYSKAELTLM